MRSQLTERPRAQSSDAVPVLITGSSHPHRGEAGRLFQNDVVQPAAGPPMACVDLDTEHLGVSSCYCEAADWVPTTFSYQLLNDDKAEETNQ